MALNPVSGRVTLDHVRYASRYNVAASFGIGVAAALVKFFGAEPADTIEGALQWTASYVRPFYDMKSKASGICTVKRLEGITVLGFLPGDIDHDAAPRKDGLTWAIPVTSPRTEDGIYLHAPRKLKDKVNLLACINDSRSHLFEGEKRIYSNVIVVPCVYKNCPRLAVVVLKTVEKGDELFLHRGYETAPDRDDIICQTIRRTPTMRTLERKRIMALADETKDPVLLDLIQHAGSDTETAVKGRKTPVPRKPVADESAEETVAYPTAPSAPLSIRRRVPQKPQQETEVPLPPRELSYDEYMALPPTPKRKESAPAPLPPVPVAPRSVASVPLSPRLRIPLHETPPLKRKEPEEPLAPAPTPTKRARIEPGPDEEPGIRVVTQLLRGKHVGTDTIHKIVYQLGATSMAALHWLPRLPQFKTEFTPIERVLLADVIGA